MVETTDDLIRVGVDEGHFLLLFELHLNLAVAGVERAERLDRLVHLRSPLGLQAWDEQAVDLHPPLRQKPAITIFTSRAEDVTHHGSQSQGGGLPGTSCPNEDPLGADGTGVVQVGSGDLESCSFHLSITILHPSRLERRWFIEELHRPRCCHVAVGPACDGGRLVAWPCESEIIFSSALFHMRLAVLSDMFACCAT